MASTARMLQHKLRRREANARSAIAILLTIYNEPAREQLYQSRIKWWEATVSPPNSLFIIDSFGNSPTTLAQTQVLSFSQKVAIPLKPPVTKYSSSTYELFALKKALNTWRDALLSHDYIIKVTGKYVLPDLLSWLSSRQLTSDLILQRRLGNTEVVGMRSGIMSTVVDHLTHINNYSGEAVISPSRRFLTGNCCIENALRKIGRNYSVARLPMLSIPRQFRTPRAAGDTLPYLR